MKNRKLETKTSNTIYSLRKRSSTSEYSKSFNLEDLKHSIDLVDLEWPRKLTGIEEKLAIRLFEAVEEGILEDIRYIAEEYSKLEDPENILDVRRSVSDNEFPLFVATGLRDLETIKTLLDLGADVNCLTDSGYSVLDAAAIADDPAAFKLLLLHGARSNGYRRNNEGMNILDKILEDLACEKASQAQSEHGINNPAETSQEEIALLLFKDGVIPKSEILINIVEKEDIMDKLGAELRLWIESCIETYECEEEEVKHISSTGIQSIEAHGPTYDCKIVDVTGHSKGSDTLNQLYESKLQDSVPFYNQNTNYGKHRRVIQRKEGQELFSPIISPPPRKEGTEHRLSPNKPSRVERIRTSEIKPIV